MDPAECATVRCTLWGKIVAYQWLPMTVAPAGIQYSLCERKVSFKYRTGFGLGFHLDDVFGGAIGKTWICRNE
jgi:hypothetical protein